jgi:hypothetical protein
MSHRWIRYGAAGLALGAAAAVYGYRWRRNYVETQVEAAILGQVPNDIIPDPDFELADVAEFDAIAEYTCMESCCYTPLTTEQIEEYGYSGPAEYLGFDD